MTTLLATWDRPGEVAIQSAWKARSQGADLISTLEQGLATAELDENLIAIGAGSVPNSKGIIELDASIMEGREFRSGAVCAVTDIVPVISVARAVMEKTPHVMLAGDRARDFALSLGMKPRDLSTENSRERYAEWLKTQPDVAAYVHASTDKMGDTITMIGLEEGPHVVAASSTSGLPFKLPGRVGDSPIIGAGIYADDEVGAAGATGNGEALWREVASLRAVEAMAHGMTPQQACEHVIRHLIRRQPESLALPSVVFAMNVKGEFGAATCISPFQLWVCRDGEFEMVVFEPISL
ncbi:MAG: N(4)-(beta-N-acetylglucosaminyl)-L-asparaginase [Armatimonadetes bacterium]|nr:N(4)-(beta-N-acetylglucosaminyl)-L-asparaginase [Armatimonadota bacterium]